MDVLEATFTCGQCEVVHGHQVEWFLTTDWLEVGVLEGGSETFALGAFEYCTATVFVHGWPKVAVLEVKFEGVAAEVSMGLVVLKG